MTERQRTGWLKVGHVALELAVVAALLALAATYWPRGVEARPFGTAGLSPPAWGTLRDVLMTGPDSGEWARNALHVFHGRYEQVDPHRMPTWLGLTALAMHWTDSVVTAGHLVNHTLHLCLVLVLYALGRAGGGRGVGLLAAALGAFLPHVVADSRTFGIDMLVATAIPGSLLAGLLSARWWWLAPVGGALAALASISHFTTLPYLLPALVLVVLRADRSWWRWALTVLGFALGAAGTIWFVYQHITMPAQAMLLDSLREGITPGEAGDLQVPGVVDLLRVGLGSSSTLNAAVATGIDGVRPSWLPWGLAVSAIWLGVVGAGLGPGGSADAGRLHRAWARCDLGLGVPLLLCLAPLPVMISVGAPDRYMHNMLGVVAVLMARGLGSPLWLGELGLKRLWRLWPAGVVVFLLGGGALRHADLSARSDIKISPPTAEGVLHVRLAALLSRELPPGSGVASTARSALVISEMTLCPRSACPLGDSAAEIRNCLNILVQECPGDAPIGWVTTDWQQQGPHFEYRRAMSDWIAERWPVAGRVLVDKRAHRLFLIPREDILSASPEPR